jgi:menaquinone-specific isochorismate synthase
LEKPSENRFFLGINSVFTLNEKGNKRFSSLEKKIKEIEDNLITNRNDFENLSVPLLMGGMKFTIEHPDNNWKDFEDSTWFIPELIYLNENGRYYFVFNSIVSSKISEEYIISKLDKALYLFLTEPENEKGKELRILKKSGNEPKDKKKWKNQINQVLEKIDDGELNKIVLSRIIELIFTSEISIHPVLNKLVNDYPECTVFLFHVGKSSFIGASPETLARIKDSEMHLEILAGSADRDIDDSKDDKIRADLLNSEKNMNEHKIVVKYVEECLSKSAADFEISEPAVKKLLNIQHLRSVIKVNLNEHSSFINIIGKIHPTPAVCGLPAETALNLIKKTENHQRGLYAGLIGWINPYNEGELVLAIRSALAVGNKLIAYAGCGIVDGSSPDEEYKETELKLKPFLSIFDNEN